METPHTENVENQYCQTVQYLFDQLPMYHRIGAAAYKKDLTNTLQLCHFLGNPQDAYPTIHVGGTNGKGSVSHMLAAIFQAQGLKVGLYTSPHYKDFRERIKVNGEFVSREFVIDFVDRIRTELEGVQPSFFELSSAMAFDYFRSEKVDIAVIEVGLGGRLDSTNVIHPLASIITNISFDHMNMLGDTLQKIAFEKAGIIKTNTPVVIGEEHPESRPVFDEKAREMHAPITYASRHYDVMTLATSFTHTHFDVAKDGRLVYSNLAVNLHGDYQVNNIATVLEAVDVYNRIPGVKLITESILRDALFRLKALTRFMGRWQILGKEPLVIADSGHNEAGIQAVTYQLKCLPYRELHIVLGFANDKDLNNILPMFPVTATYYFAKADVPRGRDAASLQAEAAKFGLVGDAYTSVSQAFQAARSAAQPNDVVFVGGSIFVLGEIL